MSGDGVLLRYGTLIADAAGVPIVTLGEGDTPLVAAPALSARVGAEVLLKLEGLNPTGSFKDRGMTVAVSLAVARGARAIVCASTGNTSASAAAYAAKAGVACVVLVPEGQVAQGKLAQALAHGALVLQLAGNFDDALRIARELAERAPVALVNSVNPDRLEGQKTAAFEICDALGHPPALLALPVGNAGNIAAYHRGFTQLREFGRTSAVPELLGVQAAGAAPLVVGHRIDEPKTVATAIRIGDPASGHLARAAIAEAGGEIVAVSDDALIDAWRFLAQREGVFCEPASAAGVAGLLARPVRSSGPVVCVITGHGLKDPEFAVGQSDRPRSVAASTDEVLAVIGPMVAGPGPRSL